MTKFHTIFLNVFFCFVFLNPGFCVCVGGGQGEGQIHVNTEGYRNLSKNHYKSKKGYIGREILQ